MYTLKNKMPLAFALLLVFYTTQTFGWVSVNAFVNGKMSLVREFPTPDLKGTIRIPPHPCNISDSSDLGVSDCLDWTAVPTYDDYMGLNSKVDSNSSAISVLDKKVTFFQLEMVNGISKEVERVLTTDKNTRGMTTPTGEKLRDLIRFIVQEEIQKALDDRK